MKTPFSKLAGRCAQILTLQRENEPDREIRAFLQQIEERGGDRCSELPTPLGILRKERFFYLGPAEISLGKESFFLWQGRRLRALTAQPVYVGTELSHWQAVLVPEDEEG